MSIIDNSVVVRICDASVEIPLRGMRSAPDGRDPRIIRKGRGSYVLRAIDNASLEIRRGERIGIVGGNGNGKTTLLKLIGGMLPACSGTVQVFGKVRALLNLDAGTSPALTGMQNIKLQYALLGIRSIGLDEYIADVVEFSGLGPFIDMPVGTYSPGMKGRLHFAMNTVEPADILLLDEWLGVADVAFQQKAQDRLMAYIEKNEGFLFASHNQALVDQLTSRTIRLDKGKVLYE
jgi:ABC-type polysaccharide/polyol phosphate transport system ATPase subunit